METSYAQALFDAISRGTDHKKAVRALFDSLEKKGKTALLDKISRAFERIAHTHTQRHMVTLTIAREADRAAALAANKKESATPSIVIDSSIIGGWRRESNETLVDQSYKKHLLDVYATITQQ